MQLVGQVIEKKIDTDQGEIHFFLSIPPKHPSEEIADLEEDFRKCEQKRNKLEKKLKFEEEKQFNNLNEIIRYCRAANEWFEISEQACKIIGQIKNICQQYEINYPGIYEL